MGYRFIFFFFEKWTSGIYATLNGRRFKTAPIRRLRLKGLISRAICIPIVSLSFMSYRTQFSQVFSWIIELLNFEAEYCLFCGRRRVAVARYRMICLVLRKKNVVMWCNFIMRNYMQTYIEIVTIVMSLCTWKISIFSLPISHVKKGVKMSGFFMWSGTKLLIRFQVKFVCSYVL